MRKAWNELDLAGGGLQTANRALVRQLKRGTWAYALWLAFPLGLHALYLRAWRRAALYLALTFACVAAYALARERVAAVFALALVVLAALDLWWIERRRVQVNKTIRMALYLRPGVPVPANFRGRFRDDASEGTDDREREGTAAPDAARSTDRPRSFAEQEAALRERARDTKNRQ